MRLEWLEPRGASRLPGASGEIPEGLAKLALVAQSSEPGGYHLLWGDGGTGWAWADSAALQVLREPALRLPPHAPIEGAAWQRGLLQVEGRSCINLDSRKKEIEDAADVHTLVLLLSSGCNLGCSYCYLGHQPTSAWRKLHPLVQQRALEAAFASTKSGVLTDCGEISVARDQFFGVVEYGNRLSLETGKPIWFAVQTNGAGLDDALLDAVEPGRLHVGISVDGPPAIHDAARPARGGQSSWRYTQAAISRCLSRGIEPLAICTVAQHNLHSRDECIDAILALGVRRVLFKPVLAQGEAAGAWDSLGISPEEYAEFAEGVLLRALRDKLWWIDSLSLKFLRRIVGDPGGWRDACTSRWCGSGKHLHVVDTEGGLHSCPRFIDGPGRPLPERGPLPDLLHPSLRRQPATCATCAWRETCGGGCTLAATRHDANLPEHDPHCPSHDRLHHILIHRVLPALRLDPALRLRLGLRLQRVEAGGK